MKQTVMQEFIRWGDKMMRDYPMKELGFGQAIDKAIELLEMEKQQIIEAYKFGLSDEYVIGSEQYYTSTYGSKGSDNSPKVENKTSFGEISSQTEISDISQGIALQNQLESKVITELSDEEIEKAFTIGTNQKTEYTHKIEGAKWYREQLKSKGSGETK